MKEMRLTGLFGSRAPAWEQVPRLRHRVGVRAAGAARDAFPRGAWEREDTDRLMAVIRESLAGVRADG